MHSISNIRTILSLSFCATALFIEFFEEKKRPVIVVSLYLLSVSFHIVGLAIVLYRVAFLLLEKGNTTSSKIARIILFGIIFAIGIKFGGSIINSSFDKAEEYVLYSLQGTGYSYFWESLLSIITILLIFYFLVEFKKLYCKTTDKTILANYGATNRLVMFLFPLVFLIFLPHSLSLISLNGVVSFLI